MQIKSYEDIEKLLNSKKYQTIIQESEQVLANNNLGSNIDITDTPISPTSMDDDETPVFLSEAVSKEYMTLVNKINNKETAKEYPLVLLGKIGDSNGEKICYINKLYYCGTDDLNSRTASYDNDKLNEILKHATSNDYNFISLAHTHPNIPEEERKTTIANYLSDEVKEQEGIRESGLNISLQDFISYESLYQFYKNNPNIRTCQTIIMYNGEITMFGKENNELKRFVDIYNMYTNESVYVSKKNDKGKHYL